MKMRGHPRFWIGVAAALSVIVVVGDASATVRKVSLTPTVRAGDYAKLTVEVAPRARCAISVKYGNGVAKRGGLEAKVGGNISWSWRVGANTPPGRALIVVGCGKSGSLRLSFKVTPKPETTLPGRKVDIGGYSLYIDCEGSGSPTIVLEPLIATPSFARDDPLRKAITSATQTRVCTYDRAGIGASDPRPSQTPPTPTTFSDELHTLLHNAGVPGPYVSVGGSFSGILMLSHAIRYPDEFVGFMFSDGIDPNSAASLFIGTPGIGEGLDVRPDLEALREARFGNRPTIALYVDYDGADFARRSSNNILARPPIGVGHAIGLEAPAFAAEAARIVVDGVRSGVHLPPCEETTLPRLGGRCESVPSP
jgi:pimeloyl-ACP methyl ester carboxylesterase